MTRKPRKQDQRITYNPQQTQRYKSQFSRYVEGKRIAAEHVVHDVDRQGLIYRIPSDRSSVGYWQIERQEEEGEIDIIWEGKKGDTGEIGIIWEGKKANEGIITLTWEGEGEPSSFDDKIISGCNQFIVIAGWGYRQPVSNPNAPLEPIPFEEFYQQYKRVSEIRGQPFLGSRVELILLTGIDGIPIVFSNGSWVKLNGAGIVEPEQYFYVAQGVYVVFTTSAGLSNGSSVASIVSSIPIVRSHYEIIQASGDSGVNCELPYLEGGRDKVNWNCEYLLPEPEFSLSWIIVNSQNPGIIRNNNNFNKSVNACPPPVFVSDIKLIAIVGVTITGYRPITWECTYILDAGEFSLNWTITGGNEITNDNNISKTLTPCTAPEANLVEIEIIDIGDINEIDGETITWECIYILDIEEFSLNWTITGDNEITNDNNISKTLTPCTAPEANLTEVKIIAIADVDVSESGYKCTCPDFSKEEQPFSPPPFPSMSQQRVWTASAAGCPTWSDGKRRCKHIVAVQQVRNEEIPIPVDTPLGEA